MARGTQDDQGWFDGCFEPQSLAPVWMPFLPGDVVVLTPYATDLRHYHLLSQQHPQLSVAGGMFVRLL
jgi:hypothetical protein